MDVSNTNTVNILNEVIDEGKEQYFDFDEKVAVLIVNQGVKAALTENPFAIAQGQIVTSQSETFLARKLREGRPRRVGLSAQSISGTLVVKAVKPPAPDTVFYPNRLMITSNVACSGYFDIVTGIASADTIRRTYSLASAGTMAFDLPEGYYILPTGYVYSYTTATSGTCDFDVQGIEVAYNG
jgi:hypothetical protein